MQNDEFITFFDGMEGNIDEYKWQPDSSLGIDAFCLDIPPPQPPVGPVQPAEFFFTSSDPNAPFLSPAPSFSPIRLSSPISQKETLNLLSKVATPEQKQQTAERRSSKPFSLPFTLGKSQYSTNSAQFVPKKPLPRLQDLCSITTKQVASAVEQIAKEPNKIRQLPQPAIHGVADVSRNESERKFLSQCNTSSIEQVVLQSLKRKPEERKTTQLIDKDDIPTDPARKRGRKPKQFDEPIQTLPVTDSVVAHINAISANMKKNSTVDYQDLVETLLPVRKNEEKFNKCLEKDFFADIEAFSLCLYSAVSLLMEKKDSLVAQVFSNLRVTHRVMKEFVSLCVDCTLNPKTLISTICGILSKDCNVSTINVDSGTWPIEEPQSYGKLPNRNGINLQDRLLWVIAVFSRNSNRKFTPAAVLDVLSLARYSHQLFRFSFQEIVVSRKFDFLDQLLLLAETSCISLLVYYIDYFANPKNSIITEIVTNLCSRSDQLYDIKRVFLNTSVNYILMQHLLLHFYHNQKAKVVDYEKIISLKRDSVLLDLAKLVLDNNERHTKLISLLLLDDPCKILIDVIKETTVFVACHFFVNILEYTLENAKNYYAKLMNKAPVQNAPIAFMMEKLQVQLPVALRSSNGNVFYMFEKPVAGVAQILQMTTEPAQLFSITTTDIGGCQLFVRQFNENSARKSSACWCDVDDINNVEFCDWQTSCIDPAYYSATKIIYKSPELFAQEKAIATHVLPQPTNGFVQVQNSTLCASNAPCMQFIDIELLKAVVTRAFEAPATVTANDFVEQYCRERNNLLTKENY